MDAAPDAIRHIVAGMPPAEGFFFFQRVVEEVDIASRAIVDQRAALVDAAPDAFKRFVAGMPPAEGFFFFQRVVEEVLLALSSTFPLLRQAD